MCAAAAAAAARVTLPRPVRKSSRQSLLNFVRFTAPPTYKYSFGRRPARAKLSRAKDLRVSRCSTRTPRRSRPQDVIGRDFERTCYDPRSPAPVHTVQGCWGFSTSSEIGTSRLQTLYLVPFPACTGSVNRNVACLSPWQLSRNVRSSTGRGAARKVAFNGG
jgi:hypothetical protein